MCRSACQPKIAELVHVRPTCYINYLTTTHTTPHTTLHYNQPILLSHDLYDGRHTCWTTAAREVGERVLGGRVLGDRVAGDRVRALFVGGARREAEAARGCFFLCCAHMGVPRSWHPIFFGSFALRAFGSPAITAPNILLARACGGGWYHNFLLRFMLGHI